jgi:hypothetical protein
MPRGGRRPNSGRKKGSTIKKSQIIAAEARDAGLTPLEYMLDIVRNSSLDPARRDAMACASAPFIHPRLNAVAAVDTNAGAGYIGSICIIGVPRGCQFNPATQMIVYPDGTETDAPPFSPIAPTPALTDQTAAPPAPLPEVPEPLAPVIEPVDDDKVERLDTWRERRRGDDEPTA